MGDRCSSAGHDAKMWQRAILSLPPTSQRVGVRCKASIYFVSECGGEERVTAQTTANNSPTNCVQTLIYGHELWIVREINQPVDTWS